MSYIQYDILDASAWVTQLQFQEQWHICGQLAMVMMMTLTITPAVIQLQLQWYAWVKFLQLLELALCHICTNCITRQHSWPAPLIFKAIKLLPSYYLTPHPHLCLQSHQIAPNNSRTNFVPFTTITSYYGIMEFLSQSNTAFLSQKS